MCFVLLADVNLLQFLVLARCSGQEQSPMIIEHMGAKLNDFSDYINWVDIIDF
jgi:hypothetical protein